MAATSGLAADDVVTTRPRTAAGSLWGFAQRRPVLAAVLVATVFRIACALLSFVLDSSTLLPDEQQYLLLAGAVADGVGAEPAFPGYGQAFYESTWPYTAVVARVFDLLWPT